MSKQTSARVRLYYPDSRFVRLRIRNDSVHEPKNPSPNVLSPQALDLWNDVAQESEDIYGEHADAHELPEKTAWKAVRMHYEPRNGKWVKKTVSKELPYILPTPGDVAWLGKFLDYAWIDMDGHVYKRTFTDSDPPDLWWNKDQKTLYCFPGAAIPNSCAVIPQDMAGTAEMFKRWAQRDANCSKTVRVPMVRMIPRGVCDNVSYRSDKWHDKNPDIALKGSGEYIHTHGDGVWVWEDTADINETPNAIMIRGGRLDVEERGIIH